MVLLFAAIVAALLFMAAMFVIAAALLAAFRWAAAAAAALIAAYCWYVVAATLLCGRLAWVGCTGLVDRGGAVVVGWDIIFGAWDCGFIPVLVAEEAEFFESFDLDLKIEEVPKHMIESRPRGLQGFVQDGL